ncbi:hypothetical protein Q9L58_005640 [Maublancomyces gigas]|uniref:Uncharacterized protein n=1 Tax=Discina gigas TaxID=1032678 RepID=A0ABR3GHP1_9PEZI
MSTNWRSSKPEAIETHPLMAAKITWHRTTMKLECEIKQLHSEVSLMAKRYHGACHEVNDMVTRLKAQPPPPVPQRGSPTQEEEGSEKERAEEDTEMGEGESRARESGEGSEYKEGQSMKRGQCMGRSMAVPPPPKRQQQRTPSPTPEPARPVKLSWCEANPAEGQGGERRYQKSHEEGGKTERDKKQMVVWDEKERGILEWGKQMRGTSALDRECWVVNHITGEEGYRCYRLDMKDGETTKKLTYVGLKEKVESAKWARKETREDKGNYWWNMR